MHSIGIIYISKDLVEGWILVLQLASSTFHLVSLLHALSITTTLSWSSIPCHISALSLISFVFSFPHPHTFRHQLPIILYLLIPSGLSYSFLIPTFKPCHLPLLTHATLLYLLLNPSTSFSFYTDSHPSFKLGKVAPNIHRHQY